MFLSNVLVGKTFSFSSELTLKNLFNTVCVLELNKKNLLVEKKTCIAPTQAVVVVEMGDGGGAQRD